MANAFFSLVIIVLLFLIDRMIRAWSQYRARRLDKRLRQNAKTHYNVREYRLYQIASLDNLETWIQDIKQQEVSQLCSISQYYKEPIMMEECEWLRFVFFRDEQHQEVTVIDKLVLDKQVKAIESFCKQYSEQHGIDLPFCSVILFETVEVFHYKRNEDDFYLHIESSH